MVIGTHPFAKPTASMASVWFSNVLISLPVPRFTSAALLSSEPVRASEPSGLMANDTMALSWKRPSSATRGRSA